MDLHADNVERLVKMANDIARNNACWPNNEEAGRFVAEHLRRFWPRTMREDIVSYLQAGGTQLLPVARCAVEVLQTEAVAAQSR